MECSVDLDEQKKKTTSQCFDRTGQFLWFNTREFAYNKLLFWLEVLSSTNKFNEVVSNAPICINRWLGVGI